MAFRMTRRAFAALVSGILACSLVGPAAARRFSSRRMGWGHGHGKAGQGQLARGRRARLHQGRGGGLASARGGGGARMLENGGNAIDAAAAIQFALNVVEPQFSGIGGGGFMVIHLAKQNKTFVVESREKAPAAATPDMFLGQTFTGASTSGLAVGVPARSWAWITRCASGAPSRCATRCVRRSSWPKRASRSIASWRPTSTARAPPCSRRPRRSSVCRTAVRCPKAICSNSPTSPRPSA